jgi:hypothetical protein
MHCIQTGEPQPARATAEKIMGGRREGRREEEGKRETLSGHVVV